MRCPKCGFISFDHLDNCLKCKKEFKGSSAVIQGTIFMVQAPSFLKIQSEPERKSFGDIEIDSDVESDEFELQDPDLEILLDDEGDVKGASGMASPMVFGRGDGDREISTGDSFELSLDTAKEEEEEGITIDLGQFQNDLDDGNTGFDDIFGGKKEDEKISHEFPEELADISDLSPPHQKIVPPPVQKPAGKAGVVDDFDLNLDLDLTGFDRESFAVPKEKKTAGKIASLSLDEIDLPTAAKPGTPARKSESDAMNMDEELNFDLDLGGLSIHKD